MEIVITRPGTRVIMRDGRLMLRHEKEVYRSLPLNHINTLICLSGVSVSEPVMSTITGTGGSIVFVHRTGKLKYMAQPLRSILTVRARMSQYQLQANHGHTLYIARQLVYAKVQNGQRFLTEKLQAAEGKLGRLRDLRDRIKVANSLPYLRGLEGQAAREYFEQYRELIPGYTSFAQRRKRQKTDLVNCGLDFLYSLLYHSSFAALTAVGLDPYLGFYHTAAYGHAALTSDLMEPFRAQVADRVMLKALKDPEFKSAVLEGKGVSLLSTGMIRLLMKYYTQRIHSIQQGHGRERTNFELLLDDAAGLRSFCLDPSVGYSPWVRS